MSYPILYKANEIDFSHLGLGVLSDATSALVTEERNGKFELEIKYPIDGALFDEIKNDRLIKVDASNNLKNQRFKIIRITKPAKGLVTIYAEHISYLTQDLALEPEVEYTGDGTNALNAWSSNIVDEHPFTTYSDITTIGSGKWTIDKVENARRALGGVRGSILDTYGGEYRFDNYHIGLYRQRGNDRETLIAYGKNIIDLEQEEEIASTYTSVYPFVVIHHEDDTEEILTLPERYIDSQYVDSYARRKILTVDFTSEGITSIESLRTRTERYVRENNVGVPKVNLRIEFLDLTKTLDYKNLKAIENINLCDIVVVYFEKLGIRQKAKIIKTVWDVLLDRYDHVEIGDARASLSSSIDTIVDDKLEPIENRLDVVYMSANGKNKIFKNSDMPLTGMTKNDIWYRPVGDGEIEMYIYNGEIWELEAYSADALKGTVNAANVNVINLNANNMTTGTLKGGEVYFNLDSGMLEVLDDNKKQRVLLGNYTFGKYGLLLKDSTGNKTILDEDGILQTWQEGRTDNIASNNPLKLSVFIPENTRTIHQAILRIKREYFRAYSETTSTESTRYTSTSDGGGSSGTSGGGGGGVRTSEGAGEISDNTGSGINVVWTEPMSRGATDSSGNPVDVTPHVHEYRRVHSHEHDLSIGPHTHNVSILSHTHNVNFPSHSHQFTISGHDHDINHGIFEYATLPSNLRLRINGTLRTAAVSGGTYINEDRDDLDITNYLVSGQWNEIEVSGIGLGRIDATIFIQALMNVV